MFDVVETVGLVPVESGVHDPQELVDHVGDDGLVGMAEQVDLVDVYVIRKSVSYLFLNPSCLLTTTKP